MATKSGNKLHAANAICFLPSFLGRRQILPATATQLQIRPTTLTTKISYGGAAKGKLTPPT